MKLMDFLFGKKPGIFNKKGKVEQSLKKDTWTLWENRYTEGEEYNWKKHSGTKYTNNSPPNHREKSLPPGG